MNTKKTPMTKVRCCLLAMCGVLLFAGGFCLLRLELDWPGLETLPYLLIGAGCGLFGYGLGDFLSRLAQEKDPALAKQLEIETQDERNIMIGNAAKAKGFEISNYIYSALLLAFALMDPSFSIIIPFVVAYLFVQFYAVYQRIQLEKQL